MYDELVKKIRHCATDPMHCLSCGEVKDGRCFKRLMTQAAEAIEKLSAIRDEQKAQIIIMAAEIEEQQPRWIPVSEKLPEAGERVLCYCRANIYKVMKMRTSGDWVYEVHHIYMHSFVTHWMPLPKGPEEE